MSDVNTLPAPYFTTIARELADAASDIADSVSSASIASQASHATSASGSSIGSGSHPASVASSAQLSADLGPAQTQALLGSAVEQTAAAAGKQVRFESPAGSVEGSQRSSHLSSGSGSVGSQGEFAVESEGTDVRRMLLHLFIPAAVFAGVFNVAPLIAHERLATPEGKLDKKKLLMASGIAAGVAFIVARLVI